MDRIELMKSNTGATVFYDKKRKKFINATAITEVGFRVEVKDGKIILLMEASLPDGIENFSSVVANTDDLKNVWMLFTNVAYNILCQVDKSFPASGKIIVEAEISERLQLVEAEIKEGL